MIEKWEVWVKQPTGAWRRAVTTCSAEHVELLKESYLQLWAEIRVDHSSSTMYSSDAA